MMRYERIQKELFIKNRRKLTKLLKPGSLVVVHSNDEMPRNGDQTYNYRQSSDLFYLSGIPQEKTVLLLFPDHPEESKREILFSLKADKKTIIWEGPKLSKNEINELSGIETILWLQEFESILHSLIVEADHVYVNVEETLNYLSDIPSRNMRFIKKLKENYPSHKYERLGPLLTKCRIKKEPEEILIIEKACKITSEAFNQVLKATKPGMKEYEIEAEITSHFIKSGANGHAYQPIIASGKNNCYLHYINNSKVCKSNELLLLDFGAEYAFYAADLSRTIPVNGKFNKRQLQVYKAVLDVLKAIRKEFIPGKTIAELNHLAEKLIEEQCIKLNLITKEDLKKNNNEQPLYKKYFMHGVSHFIGLDVHDRGTKHTLLEEGMVLSCEPAIYIQEEGFGIRLENNIIVGKKPKDSFESTPIEPEEIEELMKK